MTRKRINCIYLSLILPLLMLSSCNNDIVYTEALPMDGNTWKLENMPVFTFDVTDTVSTNDISFMIRTGNSYPYRNIYLFVTTSSPDGQSRSDTLHYYLADEKGDWYGKGFGDIHELTLPYRRKVYFPHTGTYSFKIQHGMRIEDLKGVYDFGVRIEKSEN